MCGGAGGEGAAVRSGNHGRSFPKQPLLGLSEPADGNLPDPPAPGPEEAVCGGSGLLSAPPRRVW